MKIGTLPPNYPTEGRVDLDFKDGGWWLLEMMRTTGGGYTLVWFAERSVEAEYGVPVSVDGHAFYPLAEDEITRHVRFPQSLGWYRSVDWLLADIDTFFVKCLDLDPRHRFLLACFVVSTWLVDHLPVAPYIALTGLPRSGKSTTLHALSLICRHGLLTSDISSAALYRACDRLTPTLCIDETATASQSRALFHLLRSGTSRNAIIFREGRSYHCYGAKVFVWTEMPKDDALNSRCIMIPLRETTRQDLLRTDDPAIIQAAEDLQAKLLVFRLFHYRGLKRPQIAGMEQLRSRDRDLYEALAMPIAAEPKACAHLLHCFTYHQELDREPLPPSETAVIESLFRQIHIQPNQEAHALRPLRVEANKALADAGERFRLSERAISGALRTLGFDRRKRTNLGYVVLIDRAARQHVHTLLGTYGVKSPASCLERLDPCEFCQPEALTNQDPSIAANPLGEDRDSNGCESNWNRELKNPDELRKDWMAEYDAHSDEELKELFATGDDGYMRGRDIDDFLRWRYLKYGPAFLRNQPPATPVPWTIPPREDVGRRERDYPPARSATWERYFGTHSEFEQVEPPTNPESDGRDTIEQKGGNEPGRRDLAISPGQPGRESMPAADRAGLHASLTASKPGEANGLKSGEQTVFPDQNVGGPADPNMNSREHSEHGEHEKQKQHPRQVSAVDQRSRSPKGERNLPPGGASDLSGLSESDLYAILDDSKQGHSEQGTTPPQRRVSPFVEENEPLSGMPTADLRSSGRQAGEFHGHTGTTDDDIGSSRFFEPGDRELRDQIIEDGERAYVKSEGLEPPVKLQPHFWKRWTIG